MAGFEVHLEELVQPRRCLGAEPHFRRRNRLDERGRVWRFVGDRLNLVTDGALLWFAGDHGGKRWVLDGLVGMRTPVLWRDHLGDAHNIAVSEFNPPLASGAT